LITDPIRYRRMLLILCVAWLVLNFSVLFRGKVLPWDAINQFYPTVYFNAHSLREGMAPWWNPYIYGGYAQLGDPQGMLFSPLLMAWMLLPSDPGAQWFSWGILLHLLMGGAAMLALIRRHGASAFGALVGAAVFMAGGVAASRLEHAPIVVAYGYLPLVLLAVRHVLAKPGIGRGCLLGLAAGAMVTQLVQVTYLFVWLVVAYTCLAVLRRWRESSRTWRCKLGASLAAAVVVAAALGLPQLVFSWASLSLSNRSTLPLAAADGGSLDVRAFLFFLYPNAYDGLRGPATSSIDPVQAFLYIGVLPSLALMGLGRAWRVGGQRRAIVCFAALAVSGAVYMLGTHTPVYGWLYTWMPGLIHFRRPSDGAYVLNVALAFLAGIGASQLDLRSRRDVGLLMGTACVWLVVIAILSRFGPHGAPVIGLVAAIAALWQLRKTGSEWRSAFWLMLVVVADYRSFNFNGAFNSSTDYAAQYVAHPAVSYLEGALATADANAPRRITTEHAGAVWDNMGMVPRIASTQGYNPLRYALYERWYQPRENSTVEADPPPYNALPEARLDDLLGVRYLVVGHGDKPASYRPPPDYRKVQSFPFVDIWLNEGAYPHFLSPTMVHALGVGEVPNIPDFVGTDFATTLWLSPRDTDDLATGRTAMMACAGNASVEPILSTPTRLEVRTESRSGGWIVASDLDHPGWIAELDGEPLPIHRANGMFRAVCVPAGEHRLAFAFHPWRMVAYAWRHRDDVLSVE
jgi:hypothetical protein